MNSIKIFTLLALLLATIGTASAQHRKSSQGRQFDLELRGGINFCQIDGDASGSYNKLGFHGAVNTSFPINDDGRWSSLDRHISLTYVEIPLMIAYDLLDSRQLRLAAGIAPAILAKANVTTDNIHDNLQSENYKTLDVLPICASIRYRLTEHLGIDVRYYNSMLNIAKENGSGTYRIFRSNKGQFSRLLQAGLTVSF